MNKTQRNKAHPNAPTGGGGPGAFRSAAPLGVNLDMDSWFSPNPLGLDPLSIGYSFSSDWHSAIYGLSGGTPDTAKSNTELDWEQVKKDFERWEGKVSHMYLDTRGYVTVGIGKMLPNVATAQQLKFVSREQEKPATAKEIETDFNEVKKQPAAKIASSYKKHTKLDLPDEVIYSLLKTVVDGFESNLKGYYKDYKAYPSSAKRALLDMIYNLGFGRAATKDQQATGLHQFTPLKKAVEAGDWQKAAENCHRKGPSEERNNWTRDLFLEAAKSK